MNQEELVNREYYWIRVSHISEELIVAQYRTDIWSRPIFELPGTDELCLSIDAQVISLVERPQ